MPPPMQPLTERDLTAKLLDILTWLNAISDAKVGDEYLFAVADRKKLEIAGNVLRRKRKALMKG